jgi:FAD/FMN-containing dehydrogenase
LSVRGGGHDWAGRALCDGFVIDVSGMNRVDLYLDNGTASIGGGTRAAAFLAAVEPFGMAGVTGSCSPVGMAGLTLGNAASSLRCTTVRRSCSGTCAVAAAISACHRRLH